MRHLKRLWHNVRTMKRPPRDIVIRAAWVLCAIVFVVVVIKTHSPRAGTVAFTDVYHVSLIDYDGKTVKFDTFRQKPLIVFFWATWCPYCNAELTHLGDIKAEFGDRVQILAVNRGESRADAKAYSDALNLPKGIVFLLDQNDGLFKQLKGYAVPETVFVNSRGEEVVHQHGPMKPAEADQAVQKLF